jgi:hypothetical protein
VFRPKMNFPIATLFGFLLPACAQTPSSGPPTLELPAWLAPFPGALGERTHAGPDETSSSYQILKSSPAVIAHYRMQLKKAEIHSTEDFDGIGTVIRCSEGRASCVIQIREGDDGSSVKVSYSSNVAAIQPVFIVPAPSDNSPAQAPSATPPPPAKKADDGPGLRQIQYEITGTVHVVNITYRNASGGTEQNRVIVPYNYAFFAPPGAPLYLSAQKTRFVKMEDGLMTTREIVVDDGIEGTVHVLIRVGGKVLQEADASAPHGIATASGEVAK